MSPSLLGSLKLLMDAMGILQSNSSENKHFFSAEYHSRDIYAITKIYR